MKLKTLKDLGEPRIFGIDDLNKNNYERILVDTEIKQEAIKLVKDMDITKSVDYCNGRIDFIMEFFNITREDLSQGMTQEVPK